MKRLFLALALLMFLPHGAFAASCNPDTDNFTIDGWCVNKQGTLIPKSTGSQQSVVVHTTATTGSVALTATQSGAVITDMGGSATGPTTVGSCNKYTLPRAAPGLTYTLSTGSKCTATLDTLDTSDTILYSISGTGLDAGDSIKSTGQAGDSVTVTSTVANKWTVSQMKSVWTDNGTN